MSYGLFEHMAYTDDAHRVERRKAIALARVRANKRFARFIGNQPERLALVAGDMQDCVRQACAETNYPDWESVYEAITASFGMEHEAVRMPKMCPYHREVTDISLAAGEAQAGFGAMAQHAWGANHCQGEWEGKCNFKPEMTTQTYWDNKAEKAQERREQRELERQQQEQMTPQPEQIQEDLDSNEPGFAEEAISDAESEAVPAEMTPVLEPAMASRTGEALKTIDVEKSEGPVPSMNKDKWTPENVSWDKDAEMDGTPHPTRHQDIKEPVAYNNNSDDGRFDQTDAVTEKQKVTQDGGVDRQADQGGTFPKGNQANPITSAQDPDKNPLREEDEEEEENDE